MTPVHHRFKQHEIEWSVRFLDWSVRFWTGLCDLFLDWSVRFGLVCAIMTGPCDYD